MEDHGSISNSGNASRGSFAIVAILLVSAMFVACGQDASESGFNSSARGRYLYVASGTCYAGGASTLAGNSTVAKFDMATGSFAGLVADYNTFGNGDLPAAVANFDANRILIAIENAAGRRIDILNRDGSGLTTYVSNATALNGIIRHLTVLADSSILISKATAIEKFSASRMRLTQGALPFINAPAAPCATSTTLMTSTLVLPGGKIVYTHAGASPNNLIGVIASTGYATAASCLASQAAPQTTSLPTSSLYVPSKGKLLVAFGSATAANNVIQSYDIDTATGAISGEVEAWNDQAIVQGPTRMIYDDETETVLIANGASALNNIEKFTLGSDGVLTKVGSTPFVGRNVYTQCITSLEIGK